MSRLQSAPGSRQDVLHRARPQASHQVRNGTRNVAVEFNHHRRAIAIGPDLMDRSRNGQPSQQAFHIPPGTKQLRNMQSQSSGNEMAHLNEHAMVYGYRNRLRPGVCR